MTKELSKRKKRPVYSGAVIILCGFLVTTSVLKQGLETNEPRALQDWAAV